MLVEAVAQEADREGALLDRPDRAAMVAIRVVGRVLGRERADAPATKQIVGHEAVGRAAHQFGVGDPGGQASSSNCAMGRI